LNQAGTAKASQTRFTGRCLEADRLYGKAAEPPKIASQSAGRGHHDQSQTAGERCKITLPRNKAGCHRAAAKC